MLYIRVNIAVVALNYFDLWTAARWAHLGKCCRTKRQTRSLPRRLPRVSSLISAFTLLVSIRLGGTWLDRLLQIYQSGEFDRKSWAEHGVSEATDCAIAGLCIFCCTTCTAPSPRSDACLDRPYCTPLGSTSANDGRPGMGRTRSR
ncbi:hypothetical protein FA95DRAFT_764732 [Auriscalpium vulgare]|uniref:Uncharacterized protein n=1 Tax=Auriscalpium vulgare TaxID=40419 RepID=A0ACB8RAR8_9AGAM|nr:hypothetical protein FA95DRAFT_764732 [Auriscalpium vulgare]